MPVPNQTALVIRIKADLIARGVIPSPQQDNGDSFEITGRVAWAMRDKGAKLIRKSPAQNGWTVEKGPYQGQRFSHDSLHFSDGWVDCLASAGPPANENRPVWQWTDSAPPSPTSVADPFDLDALDPPSTGNGEDHGDTGGGVPIPDLVAIIQGAVSTAIDRKLDELTLAIAPLKADLDELKAVQARGLQIPYLGLAKPPAAKKNGQG